MSYYNIVYALINKFIAIIALPFSDFLINADFDHVYPARHHQLMISYTNIRVLNRNQRRNDPF